MKKIIVVLLISIVLISLTYSGFVIAEKENKSDKAITGASNHSDDSEDEEKDLNETEDEEDDLNEIKDKEKDDNSKGVGLGQIIRNRIKAGVYTNENGDEIRVSEMAQDKLRLKIKNISVDFIGNLSEEKIQNKSKLKVHLNNGKDIELKIMPDSASQIALEKLKLKVCSEKNNCTIQLKETGVGEKAKLAYEMQIERHKKILWLFKTKALEKAEIDAETGEVISIKKPWWAFLASDSE